MKKTNSLHLRISPESKKNLEKKAQNLGLNLTNYIEKIANEPVIFMDGNIQRFLKELKGGLRKNASKKSI